MTKGSDCAQGASVEVAEGLSVQGECTSKQNESGRGTRCARGVSTEGQQVDKGTECARAYWNKHVEMSVQRDKCARGISAPGEQISKRSKHGKGAVCSVHGEQVCKGRECQQGSKEQGCKVKGRGMRVSVEREQM